MPTHVSTAGRRLLALLAAGALGPVAALAQTNPPAAGEPVRLTDEARSLHREFYVFDGHNDLPWALREAGDAGLTKFDLRQPQPKFNTDIPRLRAGGLGAQFWSVYVPCDRTRSGRALIETLEQIAIVRRLAERYPDVFELSYSAADVERIRAAGKIASLIGVEGGHSIENSLGVLRQLHAEGARYMTLTHADSTDWADSATDEPRHGGLTPFGEEVVREMNRLGMLVDISHVSADTMRDVLAVSRAPVIASHSSADAVAPHPRNVPDDVLKLIGQKRGVVMVNFFSGFVHRESAKARAEMFAVRRRLRAELSDEKEADRAYEAWQRQHPIQRGSVRDVVDHIDHIVQVAGIDSVGLGGDFDGVALLPEQLDDVAHYPYVTQELLNRGYDREQIRKILFANVFRVLAEAGQKDAPQAR